MDLSGLISKGSKMPGSESLLRHQVFFPPLEPITYKFENASSAKLALIPEIFVGRGPYRVLLWQTTKSQSCDTYNCIALGLV